MSTLIPLIPILFTSFSDEKVNSVSAKKLYEKLDIRKDFSNWIKNQIQRADLVIDKDYLTHALKGVGGQFDKVDYILTLDSAKHIAMMSQSKEAKKVRDYFIKVEKSYINQLKEKALTHLPSMPTVGLSVTDKLFSVADKINQEEFISKALTQSDIRVTSSLVRLIGSKKYTTVTNCVIANDTSLPVGGIKNLLTQLERNSVIARVNDKNEFGRLERRVSINPALIKKYPFLHQSEQSLTIAPPATPTALKSETQQLIEYQNYIININLKRYSESIERMKGFREEEQYSYKEEIATLEERIKIENFYKKHNQGEEPLNREHFELWLMPSDRNKLFVNLVSEQQSLSKGLESMLDLFDGYGVD